MANRGLKAGLEARINNAALVKTREALGMSRKEAAEKIGISLCSLYHYENMTSYPSPQTQEKICGFYRQNGQPLDEKSTFPEYMRVIADRRPCKGISIPSELTVPLSSVKESCQIDTEKIDAKIVINELLKDLKERYKGILTMRYGLEGNAPKSLAEVAKEYNISRERVRIIEAYAIKELRKKFYAVEKKAGLKQTGSSFFAFFSYSS